jgi:hypothetical protein
MGSNIKGCTKRSDRNALCIVDNLIYPQDVPMAHEKISKDLFVGIPCTRLSDIQLRTNLCEQIFIKFI